jgi:hypothetical protein
MIKFFFAWQTWNKTHGVFFAWQTWNQTRGYFCCVANLKPNTCFFCAWQTWNQTHVFFWNFSVGMSMHVTLKEVTDISIFQMSCSLMLVDVEFVLIHTFVVLDSHRQVTDSRHYSRLGNNTGLGFSS